MAVDDSYTKVLLHCDGTDASTTFTDESGKVWTAAQQAQLDTAAFKFGTAAGLFDGSGDIITTPDHDDFDTETGAFTIDFWIKTTSSAGAQVFYQGRSDGYYNTVAHLCLINRVAGKFSWSPAYKDFADDPAHWIDGTTTINDGTWHHIACVRTGDNFLLFIDGTQEDDTLAVAGYDGLNAAYVFTIGGIGGNYAGWIDEFRFSKGIARWITTFTPPTAAYPPSYDTSFKPTITMIR